MIWAALAALGVPLWVIALALLSLLWKRRQVAKLPDVFSGRARVVSGELTGLKKKFRSVQLRWVHDVLVVYAGMGRTTVLPLAVARVDHGFRAEDVKHVDDARVLALRLDGDAAVEIAIPAGGETAAAGPFLGAARASEADDEAAARRPSP